MDEQRAPLGYPTRSRGPERIVTRRRALPDLRATSHRMHDHRARPDQHDAPARPISTRATAGAMEAAGRIARPAAFFRPRKLLQRIRLERISDGQTPQFQFASRMPRSERSTTPSPFRSPSQGGSAGSPGVVAPAAFGPPRSKISDSVRGRSTKYMLLI
jgi:hypothetical protein